MGSRFRQRPQYVKVPVPVVASFSRYHRWIFQSGLDHLPQQLRPIRCQCWSSLQWDGAVKNLIHSVVEILLDVSFDRRKRHFDGVEHWWIGRQLDDFMTCVPHEGIVVHWRIVHYHRGFLLFADDVTEVV